MKFGAVYSISFERYNARIGTGGVVIESFDFFYTTKTSVAPEEFLDEAEICDTVIYIAPFDQSTSFLLNVFGLPFA